VPPPPTPSERRLPLRQPPAEQPFSAPIRTWNPVSNDWVLLHLGYESPPETPIVAITKY